MNLKIKILASFEFFGYQICQQTSVKYFQLKSKQEGRSNEFSQAISSYISLELSTNKRKQNTAFIFNDDFILTKSIKKIGIVTLLESQSFANEIYQN